MKFIKNEKGFTLIDITVALIIILLLMSLISVLFFNLTKTSKGIERESQATYIATNVIEAYKTLNYDDELLAVGTHGIFDGDKIGNQDIFIQDGYSVIVTVSRYVPEDLLQTDDKDNDLVKVVNVTVEYKVAAKEHQVVLETTIVRK